MTLNFVCAQYDNIPAGRFVQKFICRELFCHSLLVSESGLYLSGYCINGAIGRYVIVRAVSNNPTHNIKLGLCKVVVLSSDALTSVHCPSPAHHRLFGQKCYDIRNNEEMPWAHADSYCTEHNGTLALVESQLDHDFLTWEIGRNNVRKEPFIQVHSYWLGLRRTSDDHWVTSHGELELCMKKISNENKRCSSRSRVRGVWKIPPIEFVCAPKTCLCIQCPNARASSRLSQHESQT